MQLLRHEYRGVNNRVPATGGELGLLFTMKGNNAHLTCYTLNLLQVNSIPSLARTAWPQLVSVSLSALVNSKGLLLPHHRQNSAGGLPTPE